MSSPELTRWIAWYEIHDRARAGRSIDQVVRDHIDDED